MKSTFAAVMQIHRWRVLATAIATLLAACEKTDPNKLQGYVEGEFVFVASPLAGQLAELSVARGDQVKAGAALFTLDHAPEAAVVEQAERRLASAEAELADLRKGRRPTEIAGLEARLAQAQSARELAETEYQRIRQLFEGRVSPKKDLDAAEAALEQGRQRVSELEAELKTAQLGSRADQIRAAESNASALAAAVVEAKWKLDQKSQKAPKDGLVFDTLYRAGEWVAAGRPVVVLLPPGNVKVRAWVPETKLGGLKIGQQVSIGIDGVSERLSGTVRFISPQAEFTPPVIYSREMRSKLSHLIEVFFDPATAARLHPGQPVDVWLGPPEHGHE
jgi:HlyD family secretion protein